MGREPGSMLKDKHAQNANNTSLISLEQGSRVCSVFTASSSQNALSLTLSSFPQQSLFPPGGKERLCRSSRITIRTNQYKSILRNVP